MSNHVLLVTLEEVSIRKLVNKKKMYICLFLLRITNDKCIKISANTSNNKDKITHVTFASVKGTFHLVSLSQICVNFTEPYFQQITSLRARWNTYCPYVRSEKLVKFWFCRDKFVKLFHKFSYIFAKLTCQSLSQALDNKTILTKIVHAICLIVVWYGINGIYVY